MTSPKAPRSAFPWRDLAWPAVLALGVVSAGCGSLLPRPAAPPALFLLHDTALPVGAVPASPRPAAPASTLTVDVPRAAAGFDSRRMAYVRGADDLEYFASNQWADAPARMLAPLLVRAVERSGAFRSVVQAPSSAAGEWRLETEIVRLQQDFSVAPSRVRLTLRAVLIEAATRRVVASREFDAVVAATSDDPSGGAAAANEAAHRILAGVAAFCADAVRQESK